MTRNTDMSPGSAEVKLSGKIYTVAFTLDVVDQICAEHKCGVGDIVGLIRGSDKQDFRKNVLSVAAVLINSAIDEHNETAGEAEKRDYVTASTLSRRLTPLAFSALYESVCEAYIKGFISEAGQKDEDDIGVDDPNSTSGTA